VWTPLAYEGPARAVVHALKFHGALPLADLMAAQIVATAPPGLLDRAGAVLVPVPTPGSRRRRRGFDHAGRIADAIGRRTGLPVARCLRRTGPASRQAGARRRQRLDHARLRVAVTGPVPAAAVLVDDVHTTGATLEACARELRKGGCTTVFAVAYARALLWTGPRRTVG
jgi:predicted amidophosphoribosyltransferase